LVPEEFPDCHFFVYAVFASTNKKPRMVEEHDRVAILISAVDGSRGVGLVGDGFAYVFGNRVKTLMALVCGGLTPLFERKHRMDIATGFHSLALREALNYWEAAPPVIALIEGGEAEESRSTTWRGGLSEEAFQRGRACGRSTKFVLLPARTNR